MRIERVEGDKDPRLFLLGAPRPSPSQFRKRRLARHVSMCRSLFVARYRHQFCIAAASQLDFDTVSYSAVAQIDHAVCFTKKKKENLRLKERLIPAQRSIFFRIL